MKKNTIVLVLAFIATICQSMAMSWTDALTSPEKAKQYGIEHSIQAWAGSWSESMLPSSNSGKLLYSQDPLKLGSVVANESFDMKVTDITKPVQLDVQYFDESFNLLLYGSRQTVIVQGVDGTCHSADSEIVLELPDMMVFKTGEEGLSQAFVRLKDENGNIIDWIYLSVNQSGDITYDTSLLGKSGELITMKYVNGVMVSSCRDIKTGYPMTTLDVASTIKPKVHGMVEVSDDSDILVFVESTNNVASALPFALMTVTKESLHQVVAISSEGEIANGFWIREAMSEDGTGTYQVIHPQNPYILFKPGKWWVTFTWGSLRGPNVPVVNPNRGKG